MQYPAITLSLLLSLPALADDEQLPDDTDIPCLKEAIAIYKKAKADNPELSHEMLIAIGGTRYQQCLSGSKNVGSQTNNGSETKPLFIEPSFAPLPAGS